MLPMLLAAVFVWKVFAQEHHASGFLAAVQVRRSTRGAGAQVHLLLPRLQVVRYWPEGAGTDADGHLRELLLASCRHRWWR